MRALGAGLDFLSVTVGREQARVLLALTEHEDFGKAQAGFGRSEQRLSVGGRCWRRWEPHQESKKWGNDYECWEWSGGDARYPAVQLRGVEGVRPSRVDVAFDFSVEAGVLADVFMDSIRAHVVARGISEGITGQGGVNTFYVGAKSSDRRIRIYRRDLKDGALLMQFGGVLRVELILKDVAARSWWAVWAEEEKRGFGAAAAHIFEMAGHRVMDSTEGVPAALLDASPEADAAQMFFQFVVQNSALLGAAERLGVNVFELAAVAREVAARATRARARERDRKLGAGLDGTLVERLVIGMLRSRTPSSFT